MHQRRHAQQRPRCHAPRHQQRQTQRRTQRILPQEQPATTDRAPAKYPLRPFRQNTGIVHSALHFTNRPDFQPGRAGSIIPFNG